MRTGTGRRFGTQYQSGTNDLSGPSQGPTVKENATIGTGKAWQGSRQASKLRLDPRRESWLLSDLLVGVPFCGMGIFKFPPIFQCMVIASHDANPLLLTYR
ncbi:hypothetical protein PMIN06_001805 [Paraphaeosphaeria minitans]